MAKKQYHYYVAIPYGNGVAFVTKVNNANKTWEINLDEKPLEMPQFWARDLCLGANLNLCMAFVVESRIELVNHYIKREGEN